MTPRVWTNFDPRVMVGRIYVGDHWTLLYIKYISCGPELKWREVGWLAHLLNFLCLYGALCGPWAMATRVPVQSAQKPYASFPEPYVPYMKFDHNSRYILL